MKRMIAVPITTRFGPFSGVFFRFGRPCLSHPAYASTGCPRCAEDAEAEIRRRERRAKRQPPLIMEYTEG